MYNILKRRIHNREVSIYKKGFFFKTIKALVEGPNGKISITAKKSPFLKAKYEVEINGEKKDTNYSRNTKKYSSIELPKQVKFSRKVCGDFQFLEYIFSKKEAFSFLWEIIQEVSKILDNKK